MKLKSYYKSDKGSVRDVNQDSVFAGNVKSSKGNAFLGVVCDGMGGLSCGEIASDTVVKAFQLWLENDFPLLLRNDDIAESVFMQWGNIIAAQNTKIRNYSMEIGSNIGTTMAALLVLDRKYYLAHVGDTRVYRIDSNEIVRMTRDHSLVEEMYQAGLITAEEILTSPKRNVITRCIGIEENVCADYSCGEIENECFFLMCTDGFYSGLDCHQIAELIGGYLNDRVSLKKRIDLGVETRIASGEKDNISALLLHVGKARR